MGKGRVASTDTFTTESIILPVTRGAAEVGETAVENMINLTLNANGRTEEREELRPPPENIHRYLKSRQWAVALADSRQFSLSGTRSFWPRLVAGNPEDV